MTPLRDRPHRTIRIIGFLGYGLILYALGFLFQAEYFDQGFFVSLVLTPLCLGAMAQTVFDPARQQNHWWIVLYALGLTAVMLAILWLIEVETLICIVVSLPIIIPLEMVGVILARSYLGQNNTTMNAALFLLPLLALPAERYVTYPQSAGVVISKIIIDAPTDAVWGHTVVIPPIQEHERIWTLSHMLLGAPQPVSAEVEGNLRQLKWTKGVRFQEIITERIKHERLAWNFSFNDPQSLASFDPHISPNSEMLRVANGFYQLSATADGRTLVQLQTHYTVRSPFNAYLNLWGHLFLNDFQNSVLAVIKSRSEGAI